MRLVIAEKPSVATDLARVVDPEARRAEGYLVGNAYTWTWALGHLIELTGPEKYQPELQGRWRIELLPVIPDRFALQPREGRQRQLSVIRNLIAQAESVVVATDAGREGELIWDYIREVTAYEGPATRLWLSESTPTAVRSAFAALRPPMVHLAAAARARAEADWVVGMNSTMALSAKHGGLWSAGRVQTPTLALLCTREAEIGAFRPEDYYVVAAGFHAEECPYAGRWFRGEADRLSDQGQAEGIAARARGQEGKILSVARKQTTEQAPRLFNLTDLQRIANVRFGMTAAKTLAAAQSLYESHKALTYPRTDSRHVTTEVFRTFPARLRAVRGELAPIAARLEGGPPHLPSPGKRVVDDSKVTDHHALLPTAQAANPSRLNPDEAKVYDLVVRRFLATLLPPAIYDDTEAITEVAGETFRSKARVVVTPGWREVEPPSPPSGNRKRGKGPASEETADGDGAVGAEPEEAHAGDLAALLEGMPSRCLEAEVSARQTKPPARYSEAGLLKAMETAGRLVHDDELAEAMRERGLGTPATRAAIIETLVRRDYIQRERKALVPTKKGESLMRLAPPELRGAETTGEWERRLREIEAGRAQPDGFLAGIAELTRRIVQDVAGQQRAAPVVGAKELIGPCPRCGGAVIEGRKGFGCANWRPEAGGCRWIVWKAVAGKALTAGQARELLAAGETKRPVKGFRSKAGNVFEARLRLDREAGRVSFVFDAEPGAGGFLGSKAMAQPRAASRPVGSGARAKVAKGAKGRVSDG